MYLKYCCDKCGEEFQHDYECLDHEKNCDNILVWEQYMIEYSEVIELLEEWDNEEG